MTENNEHKERWASLDRRSLSLFRLFLGLTLLLDLLTRLPYIEAFYTDQGVLPRLLLSRSEFANEWISLHMGVGHWTGQLLLFLLQGVLAVALVLGWRTQWVTFGSWFLLNSLMVRNPFVNDRGDLELVLLLFWSLFLPLSARWSLDAKAGRQPRASARGLPAAAYIFQIALIYLWAGLLKYGEFWLVRGDGLYHSLRSPLFATSLAGRLAEAPPVLLKILNFGVIAGELFAAFLILSPFTVSLMRKVALPMLVVFHLSVAALFHLGLFPWIGIIALIPLLPADLWESRLGRRIEGFLDRRATEEKLSSKKLFSPLKPALVLFMLTAFVTSAASRPDGEAFEVPAWVRATGSLFRLTQHWELFSPIPPYHGTFTLENSQGDAVTAPPFRTHRWRMLMIASLYPRFALVRPGIVRNLAEEMGGEQEWRYNFSVRLVGKNGELQPPEQWNLWSGRM